MSTLSTIGQTSTISSASAADPKSQKVHHAAQQFEAMLLQEMLKPLSQHEDTNSNGDALGAGAGASGPMESFGIEAVASSLARSGALGFASRIESALQRSSNGTKTQKLPLHSPETV